MKFDNIHVKPFENLWDLVDKHLTSAFEARGDPVMDWAKPSLKFRINGPLDGPPDSELSKVILIDDPNQPF